MPCAELIETLNFLFLFESYGENSYRNPNFEYENYHISKNESSFFIRFNAFHIF